MGAKLEAVEKPKAEERRRSTQNNNSAKASSEGKFPPQDDAGKNRDKVAEALGVSGKTYEKAKSVVVAASESDAPPEVIEAAKEMDRTGKVDPA